MIACNDAVCALYDMYTADELKALAFASCRIAQYGQYDLLTSLFWQAYKHRYFDNF